MNEMTPADAEHQKTRWKTVFDRWWEAGRLQGHWTAKVEYDTGWFRVGKNGKIKAVGPNGARGHVACVTVQWEYRHADVRVSLPAVAQLEDDELERYVVHEMVHFFVNELAHTSYDGSGPNPHEEHCVTQVTNFIMAARAAALNSQLPWFVTADEKHEG